MMQELGYEESDLINPSLVRAYEFASDEHGRTTVTPLERRPEGFVVPSLNDTIFSLARETIELHESPNDRGMPE